MALPLKWHGGKQYLSKWILQHFPPAYTHYFEPYAGGLSVLFGATHENVSECVNDLNLQLSNFWYVLRHPVLFEQFALTVELTPFSQVEFSNAVRLPVDRIEDPVGGAVKFFVKYRQSRQGLGKSYATPTRRLRRRTNENVSAWLSAVDGLYDAHERLKSVEVYCMGAIEFIKMNDHPNAFFYIDPPYLHETRSAVDAYEKETDEKHHIRLLRALTTLQGKFLLSGYMSEMYETWATANRFNCVTKNIDLKSSVGTQTALDKVLNVDKTKPVKTECLWFNYSIST